MTEMEIADIGNEINMCRQMLANTDYRALKFAEGSLSEEDFAPTRAMREEWRARVNALEARLSEGGGADGVG